VLGLASLRGTLRSIGTTPAAAHSHAHNHGDYVHTHPHSHAPEVHPHAESATPVARLDAALGSLSPYRLVRPLVVGIVHGLAGSAAVALLVLTAIQTPRWSVLYLLIFGLGTVAGMMLITAAVGAPFAFSGARFTNVHRHLRTAAGLISLGFGLVVAYQIAIGGGLFIGQPHWTPR